jgi:hypothetical protein
LVLDFAVSKKGATKRSYNNGGLVKLRYEDDSIRKCVAALMALPAKARRPYVEPPQFTTAFNPKNVMVRSKKITEDTYSESFIAQACRERNIVVDMQVPVDARFALQDYDPYTYVEVLAIIPVVCMVSKTDDGSGTGQSSHKAASGSKRSGSGRR